MGMGLNEIVMKVKAIQNSKARECNSVIKIGEIHELCVHDSDNFDLDWFKYHPEKEAWTPDDPYEGYGIAIKSGEGFTWYPAKDFVLYEDWNITTVLNMCKDTITEYKYIFATLKNLMHANSTSNHLYMEDLNRLLESIKLLLEQND